jgi:hypothetical protein
MNEEMKTTKEIKMRFKIICSITIGLFSACALVQEKEPKKSEQNLNQPETNGIEIKTVEAQERGMNLKYYTYQFAQNMIYKEKSFKQNGDLVYVAKIEDLEKIKGGMIRISKNKFNQSNKYTMEILDKGTSIGHCFDGENIYVGKGHPRGFYMTSSGPNGSILGFSFGNQPGEMQIDCGLGIQKPDTINVILKKDGKKINEYSVIFKAKNDSENRLNQ